MPKCVYEALVVGAGICGLSTLYHLQRLGCHSLALVEQFQPGHTRGSSHGTSRITRSSYDKDVYVELMQVAHHLEWPRLEQDTGLQLIFPTPGVLFGPNDGPIRDYAEAVQRVGIPIDVVSPREARIRTPMFRYQPEDMILFDPTCAVIAAADVLRTLQAKAASADCFFNTRVQRIDVTKDPIEVHTDTGVITAERLVVAAGPWVDHLMPSLTSSVSVIQQTVGYFEMDGVSASYEPGAFPVWIYLEKDQNEHFYGLPQFQRPGIKVARHITSGLSENPDQPAQTDPLRVADLEDFISRKFHPAAQRLVATEHCYYTNTATTDYILDRHPDNQQVVIGAGFSGHGFKLGPVSGRILAELVMQGKTSLPEFEAHRSLFQIPSLDPYG